jgi:hypothetical protein
VRARVQLRARLPLDRDLLTRRELLAAVGSG